jgi:two-component system phosphate regulon sensor histidine kinase PhoR
LDLQISAMHSPDKYEIIVSEMEELRLQLQEAQDTIQAIRTGQVDALLVKNGNEHQLYTLKSADQTYRVFIEKMKEGAVTLDKNEIILYSNSQFASMVDLPLAGVIGQSISDFIPDECKDEFRSLVSQGWLSDSKGEIPVKKKNNETMPFLLSLSSLNLDDGKALSIILTDLTHQKETENQLKLKNEQLEEARRQAAKMNEELEDIVRQKTLDLFMSREHFKFLADNIPVIIWTAQPDGTADYFNNLWYEYTGLSIEQSRGAGSQKIMHPDDYARVTEAWTQAIRKKKPFQFEFRIKRAADQQYRWHLGKGEPLKNEGGGVMAWFGTSTDIEDQKKEIEKKDEFISVASHELKTPLTSLKGYIQLIGNKKDLPEDISLYISRANGSVNKLQHLISDLLDVSKISAGKLEFSKNVFDLGELIRSCVENSNYIYPGYTIKEELNENIKVRGNAERLEQVLMNLVSNAVKYSPAKKDIIIRAEKDNSFATVSVIDQGIGMSRADQKRIFERFYRAEDNKFLAPGLGMGLYISSEIIKEHQGQLAVKSKLNEGSVFSFSLPLADTMN